MVGGSGDFVAEVVEHSEGIKARELGDEVVDDADGDKGDCYLRAEPEEAFDLLHGGLRVAFSLRRHAPAKIKNA